MISAYLEATRVLYHDVDPRLKTAYRTLYEKTIKASSLRLKDHAPKFHVVHSLNKQAEVATVGGDVYLVYDQYLGQTISELSRIFYSAEDPYDARAFAFRIYAEAYVTAGNADMAIFSAYLHSIKYNQSHKYKTLETIETKERRAQSVIVQEAFIIAHEFAHYLWSMRQVNEGDLDCLRGRIAEDAKPITNREKIIESHLDDLSFQYHGKNIPHSENILTDEDRERDRVLRAELHADFDKIDAERMKMASELKQNEAFLEELWSDWSAAQACLDIFYDELAPEILIEAVHLALENLTTITVAMKYALSLTNTDGDVADEEDSSAHVKAVALRKRILRKEIGEWAAEHFQDGLAITHNILRQANERYMRYVRDPITLDVPARFNRASQLSPESLRKFCETLASVAPNQCDVMTILHTCPFAEAAE